MRERRFGLAKNHVIEILRAGIKNVTTAIPNEAFVVFDRRREPAGMTLPVTNDEIVVSELVQPVSSAKAARPRPNDDDPPWRSHLATA